MGGDPYTQALVNTVKNSEISGLFNKIADILEIKNENPFRIRAYRKAALNIEGLPGDIEDVALKGKLGDIPGIGKDLAGKIQEYLSTGKINDYEKLRKEIPEGVLSLMNIPAIGPKKVWFFYKELGIDSLEKLEEAAKEHRLQKLPGIRQKTEENILKGIGFVKRSKGRTHLGIAWPLANAIVNALEGVDGVKELQAAGSLRRMKETIGDIDILVDSSKPDKVMDAFVSLPIVGEVLSKGATKSSIRTKDGLQVDIRVVKSKSWGAALAYFTGSKAHNIRLREMAMKKGLKISEYGVDKGGKRIAGKREEEIYDVLGLPFIPPEIREDTGEVEASLEGKLPDLVELKDIKGDFHLHTDWSDGVLSLKEMSEAVREKGYSFAAITDHTKSLVVARGVDEKRLLEQNKEIKKLNKKLKGIKIISGAEVNIMSDGTLDVSDKVLKELDWAIASIHSGFQQSKEKITWRILQAMKNPFIKAIAHPSGRLLGERDAYELDWDAVFNGARQTGTALEVNAYPQRLDINDIACRRAKELGIKVVINTDAHTRDQLNYMKLGVSVVRRGWLEPRDVLNTLPLEEFLKALRK